MMKKSIGGVLVLGLALASGSAMAQSLQGPAGASYGAGSTPQSGGITTPVQPSPQNQPSARTAPHRNYASHTAGRARVSHYGANGSVSHKS
jgi:hypothetical protein